jgi:hypothetical protein
LATELLTFSGFIGKFITSGYSPIIQTMCRPHRNSGQYNTSTHPLFPSCLAFVSPILGPSSLIFTYRVFFRGE